jgi:hypothetical protein
MGTDFPILKNCTHMAMLLATVELEMVTVCAVVEMQYTAPPPAHWEENVVTGSKSLVLVVATLPLRVHPLQLKVERSTNTAPGNKTKV